MPKVKTASGKVKHFPYSAKGKKEAMMMKEKEMKKKGMKVMMK